MNMEGNDNERKFTAAGFGSCSGQPEGSVDPAPSGSSSYEGPTVGGLVAGFTENVDAAIYQEELKELDSKETKERKRSLTRKFKSDEKKVRK